MPCSTGRAAHCITAPGCQEDGEPHCPCIGQSAFSATPFKGDLVDNKVVDDVPVACDLSQQIDCSAFVPLLTLGDVNSELIEQFVGLGPECDITVFALALGQVFDETSSLVIGRFVNSVYSPIVIAPGAFVSLVFFDNTTSQTVLTCDGLDFNL